MLSWGGNFNSGCSFCDEEMETRNHIFFECEYSEAVWKNLAGKLMEDDYSYIWADIVALISTDQKTTKFFALKYVFQATIHRLWLERNGRRLGEASKPHNTMSRMIDRIVRNRFLSIRRAGDNRMEDGLQLWFSMRPDS